MKHAAAGGNASMLARIAALFCRLRSAGWHEAGNSMIPRDKYLLARLLHIGRHKGNLRPTVLDRLDSELSFTQKALNLRAYRQELLASNIANADTPNFKARDIDFKSALENAVTGRTDGALPLARTSGRHITGTEADVFAGALKYRTEFQPNADGNTVNMDVERSAFAENALQMEAMLTFVRGKFKDMQTAVANQ